ncbi:MAG: alpha/beta hydrolase [Xanthobacteraceae bacterium]|nr:alpha/beta hydrolase [Xanthobacteraceae bacterium]
MVERVTFKSGDVTLVGDLSIPERSTTPKPAMIVMHGFGGHRNGPQQRWSQTFYTNLGYAVLRFDFQGCGESGGERGWVLPFRQVNDAVAALDFMGGRPEIDSKRMCLSGTSFGASVAVYTAGLDQRVAAVIGQGGWASGEQMFRTIHSTPEKWERFSELLKRGRARKAGDPVIMAHRYDLIVVPERLRNNIDKRSIMEFPLEMALETLAFNPGDMAARIAPRPLLLLHSAQDEVIAADGSMELFKRAGYHGDLHIIGGVDHFMFGEDDRRVEEIVRNWLTRYFPAD